MERFKAAVPPSLAGMRLDACLAQMSGLTRSRCGQLIEKGDVWLEGKTAKGKIKVKAGQLVCWQIPEPERLDLVPEALPIEILYQDEDLAVINKPRGMVVHPGAGVDHGTLVNALLYHLDHLSGINGTLRPGIVHRLDKDTSGALLIAKNDEAHQSLSRQIAEKTAQREYLCVVLGNIKQDSGLVDASIGRHKTQRKKMAVVPGGREARTNYTVVHRFGDMCLVRCCLETGRTHQIRVHMSHIGHPIVGDPVYGPKNMRDEKNGQLLHAAKISFTHPKTGERLSFYAPLDEYFKSFLKKRQINTEELYKQIWA